MAKLRAIKLEGAWIARVVSSTFPTGPYQWTYIMAPTSSGRVACIHGSVDVALPAGIPHDRTTPLSRWSGWTSRCARVMRRCTPLRTFLPWLSAPVHREVTPCLLDVTFDEAQDAGCNDVHARTRKNRKTAEGAEQ